jgi:hypothetical protein
MTAKDVTGIIRQRISDVEKSGATQVLLSSLRALIDQIDADTSVDPAKSPFGLLFTANHETALAKYRVRVDFSLELFKSVIATGQTALRSMFLINGGAAVAVLAFVGHLATLRDSTGSIGAFALPLGCFVVGLLLITIASGITYLAQRAYATQKKGRRSGNRLHGVIITASALSVVAFATGSWLTYRALVNFEQTAWSVT